MVKDLQSLLNNLYTDRGEITCTCVDNTGLTNKLNAYTAEHIHILLSIIHTNTVVYRNKTVSTVFV
jgi:hypothetical protein